MLEFPAELLEIAVPEQLRPRVMRELGIGLPWDEAVDALAPAKPDSAGGLAARCCRAYRSLRPHSIGNRCGFEPSCSRYAELCFRQHGFRGGLSLTFGRLMRCRAEAGGLDEPPGTKLGELLVKGAAK